MIQNWTHAVVADAPRNRDEAAELARFVAAGGRELQAIFVAHECHAEVAVPLASLRRSKCHDASPGSVPPAT